MTELGIDVQEVEVAEDNKVRYEQAVEAAVMDADGDWAGIGLLVTASGIRAALPACQNLKNQHPKVEIGTFDISDSLYDALDRGDVLFTIDQQGK